VERDEHLLIEAQHRIARLSNERANVDPVLTEKWLELRDRPLHRPREIREISQRPLRLVFKLRRGEMYGVGIADQDLHLAALSRLLREHHDARGVDDVRQHQVKQPDPRLCACEQFAPFGELRVIDTGVDGDDIPGPEPPEGVTAGGGVILRLVTCGVGVGIGVHLRP
jgi:hypothetical protein